MDIAQEIQTQKKVHAFQINKDSSYIKPEEDIFKAIPDSIENYDDVIREHNLDFIEVRYKKGHLRKYSQDKIATVVPHFFIPNKKKRGIVEINESPEHKKIKEFMYHYFFENEDIEMIYSKYKRKGKYINQTVKLKDLPISYNNFSIKKEDFFEIGLTDNFNTRRVDLFFKFDNFNSLWGEGLVIEVQLSSQSERIINERTLDRALKGYSTIWIKKEHFEDYKANKLELKENKLFINSWHSVIQYDSEIIETRIHNKIKKYSRLFDEKVISCENELKKMFDTFTENTMIRENMLCPVCKLGQLIKKKGDYGYFLGCSRYKQGCLAIYKLTEELKNEE